MFLGEQKLLLCAQLDNKLEAQYLYVVYRVIFNNLIDRTRIWKCVRIQLPLGRMGAEHDEHGERQGHFFKASVALGGGSSSFCSRI